MSVSSAAIPLPEEHHLVTKVAVLTEKEGTRGESMLDGVSHHDGGVEGRGGRVHEAGQVED
jgi:hypothetical protein